MSDPSIVEFKFCIGYSHWMIDEFHVDDARKVAIYGVGVLFAGEFVCEEALHCLLVYKFQTDARISNIITTRQDTCNALRVKVEDALKSGTLERHSLDGILRQAPECYVRVSRPLQEHTQKIKTASAKQSYKYSEITATELFGMRTELENIDNSFQSWTHFGMVDALYIVPSLVFLLCAKRLIKPMRNLWQYIK
jgi:hypothetical protein